MILQVGAHINHFRLPDVGDIGGNMFFLPWSQHPGYILNATEVDGSDDYDTFHAKEGWFSGEPC